jgi:hypothetical protein
MPSASVIWYCTPLPSQMSNCHVGPLPSQPRMMSYWQRPAAVCGCPMSNSLPQVSSRLGLKATSNDQPAVPKDREPVPAPPMGPGSCELKPLLPPVVERFT